MAESTRSLTDLFGMLGVRKVGETGSAAETSVTNVAEAAYATKALQKFLSCLQGSENPLLLDLGPVVGSNVTFFGEQLGCRIRVEDIAADIDRHVKTNTLEKLPEFFTTRFTEPPGTVDGILCWDILDFLDRPAAQSLTTALAALLKPDGCLLGFFSTAETQQPLYTKYVVVDHATLKYRTYPAARPRQRNLLNGDIIKLFKDLRVTDSFLMKSKVREMLFRKPARR
ncbi:MAG TPA: class I SAM-dependent methyltransferase [Vicinamibacterales bacterium]|nr:class I SAM-dependent methyltransferase [Vicinamibacterales bacterium]